MRTTGYIQNGNYFTEVTYPEPYVFAHSRHTYIRLDHFDDNSHAPVNAALIDCTILDVNSGTIYTESKYTDKQGKATFDIGRILQIMMDGTLHDDAAFDYTDDSKMVAAKQVQISMSHQGTTFFASDIETVNGADEATDNWWYRDRRLRWWCNYPFTFDFRNTDEATITINGGISTVGPIPMVTPDTMNYSRIRINPKAITESAKSLDVFIRRGMGFVLGSFSDNKRNTVTLVGDDCELAKDKIYLRWLNRHGELSYWLFGRQSLQRKMKSTDSHRAYAKDDIFDDHDTCDSGLLRTITSEGELVAYSGALDGIDYEIVRQLFTAPFVDMLLPEFSSVDTPAWQRVHVKAETQTEILRHSDDNTFNRQVTITLTLPEEGQLFV